MTVQPHILTSLLKRTSVRLHSWAISFHVVREKSYSLNHKRNCIQVNCAEKMLKSQITSFKETHIHSNRGSEGLKSYYSTSLIVGYRTEHGHGMVTIFFLRQFVHVTQDPLARGMQDFPGMCKIPGKALAFPAINYWITCPGPQEEFLESSASQIISKSKTQKYRDVERVAHHKNSPSKKSEATVLSTIYVL